MSMRSPFRIATRPERTAARVAVAVIAGPDAASVATPEQLARWWCLTPLARWCTASVYGARPAEIMHGVASVLERHEVDAHRLILVAEGHAGRAALELVLRGIIDCAGVLAIAIPCAALSFRIVPTVAAIRLVVPCQDAPADLITELRAADIDARIIGLAPGGTNDLRVAASAAETFILELVANASRLNRHHGV